MDEINSHPIENYTYICHSIESYIYICVMCLGVSINTHSVFNRDKKLTFKDRSFNDRIRPLDL